MTEEMTTAAPSYVDLLRRFIPDFDLERAAGTSTPAAWFLGPKAENQQLFEELMLKAVWAHCEDRRDFYPHDPAYVTDAMKESRAYRESVQSLKGELDDLLVRLKGSVPFFSYRYQSHMNWDLTLPSIAGYFAAMLYSPNNVAAEASPVTTLLEKTVGEDLCKMLGYDIHPKPGNPLPWAHITCDGTVANLEALWSARNLMYYPIAIVNALWQEERLARARDITVTLPDGKTTKRLLDLDSWELVNLTVDEVLNLTPRMAPLVPEHALDLINAYTIQNLGYETFYSRYLDDEVERPAVLAPVTMHYSWPKSAALLGIGQENLIPIRVDLDARADANHLRTVLKKCASERRPVVLAVSVLGSTEQSAVDPLAELLAMRRHLHGKNVTFPVHADAAWGGYFAAIKRASDAQPMGEAGVMFTPELSMSAYVNRQYDALPEADSITIDPHKAGYIPYPAGGLCYRNKLQRELVTFSAPYVAHNEGVDQSVGFYGVEGSKPGAAAAGVYLSHRVIPTNQHGYGKILGQSLFNSKRLYAALVTMAGERDPFIIVPTQRLPAEKEHPDDEKEILKQLEFIRTEIVPKSNAELYNNPELMKLFRELGSDQIIIGYAFNYLANGAMNRSVEKMNRLNARIFEKLSMSPDAAVGPFSRADVPPLIVTGSRFDPAMYGGDYLNRMRRQLGVEGDDDLPIEYLVSTTMDPWLTDTEAGNFIPELVRALRETVIETIEEIKRGE